MKISTGLSTRGNKSYKCRPHRVGTSWLHGQKLPSVRTREVKKLKVKKRYETTQEEEERREEKKTREGRERVEYTPLEAIDPGYGEESVLDPSFLHAG